MISALSGNYKRELFKPIARIIPKCELIVQLKAFCGICKEEDADFSLRIIKNNEEIYIGGDDIYKPVCRKCYFDPNLELEKEIIDENLKNILNKIDEKESKICKV